MNMRFWLVALAEPNRMAAQVLTTRPMKVSTLGLMRESASQRTMVSSRTPHARPKALVQEALTEVPRQRGAADPSLRLKSGSARDDAGELGAAYLWLDGQPFYAPAFSGSISSWIVLRLRISSSRLPL